MDAGAYCTLSPVVLSRGVIHATGPYRCDHVRIRGRATMTHTPPNGAFRGFGAPQTQFAIEAHLDRVAEALGIDPVRIRERNALRPGDTTATGQRLGADASALPVLQAAVRRSGLSRQAPAVAGHRAGHRPVAGLPRLGLHRQRRDEAGLGGGARAHRAAAPASAWPAPRSARARARCTRRSSPTRSACRTSAVEVHEVDTAEVPDSGPTVASRTCMIVGGLLERCAAAHAGAPRDDDARRLLPPSRGVHGDRALRAAPGAGVGRRALPRRRLRQLTATPATSSRSTVDPDTGEVHPTHVTAVAEIGRAIHPQMAAGQIEGGTLQGLGYALLEEVVMRDGRMANAQLTNYIIPTPSDAPSIDVDILERPYAHGPFGAKGVGEMPIDSPAPAVVNALRHAGYDLRAIPATPERVLAAATTRRPAATGGRHDPRGDHDDADPDAERRPPPPAGAADGPAARRAARGLRPDRHQGGLRRGRVRRLHRARRRRRRRLVPGAGRARRGHAPSPRSKARAARVRAARCSTASRPAAPPSAASARRG